VARKKGKRWGGSKPGWRWKVSDDQVTAIHEMQVAGKKVTHIARVTGLSRPTVYRVLRQCGCENGSTAGHPAKA
jgi:DNA invertase Pin-like site-specific DNA recombinase